MAKLAQLMFARELDRRSRAHGWGLMSNAAHPGLTKTNLLSGASYEGIKPTLYAAASPAAEGGAYYGPRGLYETAGGGVGFAKIPSAVGSEAQSRALWQLSERMTAVTYPDS